MIVDCHTHTWDASQLGHEVDFAVRQALLGASAARGQAAATVDQLLAGSKPVDKSFILGFTSRLLDVELPNDQVAAVVRQHPDRLIGFAGIDPTDGPSARAELRRAREQLGLRGVALSPAAQGYHPSDTRALAVFDEAARLRMPVLLHPGAHSAVASRMEFARPILLDEIAREFPMLKIIVAHLGYPWIDECVVLLGKHPNVFADVSALLHRPFEAYRALVTCHESGVIEKLLFGSDFPQMSATACIEALYNVNKVAQGTGLPMIPRQLLQGIVERDALPLLGLGPAAAPRTALLDDHDE